MKIKPLSQKEYEKYFELVNEFMFRGSARDEGGLGEAINADELKEFEELADRIAKFGVPEE